jgi:small subunit ribosomal protein S9
MTEKAKSKTKASASSIAVIATGRRKTSVARVRFIKGKGGIVVNDKKHDEYFPAGNYSMIINQPLVATEFKSDYDIFVNVYGGGLSSQAGAIRHAISRALLKLDKSNHKALKSNSFLTRDPRMVERKKYGQKKARKRFQFSKR